MQNTSSSTNNEKKFATTINCIDGRVQDPVQNWILENYDVDYVDTVTVPGPDKPLSHVVISEIDDIQESVEISVTKHGSKLVAIAGHYDCAGNPVSDDQHKKEVLNAVENIKDWGFNVEVIGLWVNENWEVEAL